MKTTLFALAFVVVGLAFSSSPVRADFISPKIPVRPAPVASAKAHTTSSNVWTVTTSSDRGPGSLRHAISNAAAGDRIQFAIPSFHFPGISLPSVILLKSKLVIDKDLTIAGPGPHKLIIARSFARQTPAFSVIQVDAGNVTISGVTIANGRALNPDGASDNLGGGILNFDTLTVSNCLVTQNEARTEAGGVGYGGGIFSSGPLTLLNSTFSGNQVSGAGGGIGVFHSSEFFAEGCTFNDNFAEVQGGGVNFQGYLGHIRNCTISGNRAGDAGSASGLLHLVFPAEVSALDISACTIARNRGASNGAIVAAALPGSLGSLTRMIGTIAANNLPQNFAYFGGATVQTFGHNLDTDGSSGFTNGVNGDIVGTMASPIDARLGALDFNGGLTRTHALLHGSPAVDAGACVDAGGSALTNDQRRFPRPQGVACDIGAYENQSPLLTCPASRTNDCRANLNAIVSDPDGDPLTLVWRVDGRDVQTNFLAHVQPNEPQTVKLKTPLASGTHAITVRVSDGKAAVVQCSSSVTIQNSTGPVIHSIKASPRALWPPNHKLVPVTLTVHASECVPVRCKIVSVQSNQGSGRDADWIITGDLSVKLRASRSGGRDRVYTITVECADDSGRTSRDSVQVVVSKYRSNDDDHEGKGDDHDR